MLLILKNFKNHLLDSKRQSVILNLKIPLVKKMFKDKYPDEFHPYSSHFLSLQSHLLTSRLTFIQTNITSYRNGRHKIGSRKSNPKNTVPIFPY